MSSPRTKKHRLERRVKRLRLRDDLPNLNPCILPTWSRFFITHGEARGRVEKGEDRREQDVPP